MCIIISDPAAYVTVYTDSQGDHMTLGVSSTLPRTTKTASALKPELLRLLDTLPRAKQAELLDFARFLRQQTAGVNTAASPVAPQIELRVAATTTLIGLTGLVALGGDAVADTEALYGDDNDLH
jgi:hypothetical protein